MAALTDAQDLRKCLLSQLMVDDKLCEVLAKKLTDKEVDLLVKEIEAYADFCVNDERYVIAQMEPGERRKFQAKYS